MRLKVFNRLYRRMLFLVCFVFGLLVALLLFLLFLLFRTSLFDITTISENASLIVICAVISILLVTQSMAIFWSKRITKPISTISRAVDEIAEGNFEVSIDDSKFKDEIKALAGNINKMAEELRSIEVMRSDFVSNVSHEFRAPLAAIQGYVALLGDDSITESQRKEYYTLLAESTRQLSGLVDSILKLSRLETQNIISKPVKFSLDEQLRRAVIMFENEWSAKEIDLELDLPGCECTGNEELLNQIWVNLIGNAVKFTDKGGKIGVKIEDTGKYYIVVKISDNGIGMSEEVKKHIFEKFYQGDSSRRRQGNGLGLALVKSVAVHTNCRISVESEVGKGTTFTVKVPKYSEANA